MGFTLDILRLRDRLPDSVHAAASESGLSETFLTAVALIEMHRRPLLARTIEDTLAYINVCLCSIAGIPMRNVSLGLFQVKFAAAARLLGIPVQERGNWVAIELPGRVARLLALLRVTRALIADSTNAMLAVSHMSGIERTWLAMNRSLDEREFFAFFAEAYNGAEDYMPPGTFIPYGVVLEAVASSISIPSLVPSARL